MTLRAFSLAFALVLGGCALMAEPAASPRLYVLPAPTFAPASAPWPGTIKVVMPEVAPGLDTPRIAALQSDYRLDYLARAQWSAPLPALLQARLIDAMQSAHVAKGVVSDSARSQSDVTLQLDVQNFEAVMAGDPPAPKHVHLRYRLLLTATESHKLLATFATTQDVPLATPTMESVIAAFDQADGQALKDVLPALQKTLQNR